MASKLKQSTPNETSFTLRNPPYTYIHLSVTSNPTHQPKQPLDAVTALTYLHSALQKFLGITGTAISVDILKVGGQDMWIRVPREDGSAVVAAVSQWASHGKGVSLRVVGRSSWLGGIVGLGREAVEPGDL
jgi:ribonuclease P/MRP protein subunit POP8